eukprot:7313407-Ditylum_brightwellii.AAC.2
MGMEEENVDISDSNNISFTSDKSPSQEEEMDMERLQMDKSFKKLHNQSQKDKNLIVLQTDKTINYCTVDVEKFNK